MRAVIPTQKYKNTNNPEIAKGVANAYINIIILTSIKEDEVRGACGLNERKRNVVRFLVGKPEGK
jgi:hypothetical protein